MANPKLKVSVNKNPTKEGIKVQFVMPDQIEGDAKAEMAQKLQTKLNQGLSQYNLTVSQDTDVPYSNVIGFLIPIADVKLLIKNAITGGGSGEPAPEEPVAEIKRIKKLAGIKEAFDSFLDTEEGGYMREYIDSIAEEEGLDLSYRNEFDIAFNKALELLQSEDIYPELDFYAIVAHKESFF
jgi:hypothetical protein